MQCGQQIPDEYSFCTACGAPTKSSDVDNIPVVKTNIKIDEMVSIFMGMLTKPITSVRVVTTMEMNNFAALAGIIALLWGLMGMWLVKRLAVMTGVLMENMMGDLGGFISMIAGDAMSEISTNTPYESIFFFGLFFCLAMILGLFCGQFATGKFMLKSTPGAIPCFNVAVSSQVPLITAVFFGMVLSYISVPLVLIVMKIGALVSVISVYFGLQKASEGENDRVVYALPLTVLVMYLVVYIFVRIFMSMI